MTQGDDHSGWLACRGVRGATTATENTPDAILSSTRELLQQIAEENDIRPDDVASVMFTTSPDLNAEYPALAARQMGWTEVPLMCAQEIDRPGALPRTIRVLMHWNTAIPQREIIHVYIRGAEILRPDQAARQAR